MGSAPKPYLTFRVARQDMAMEAGRVRGILPLSELEPMRDVRPGLLGVTILKGQVIGVMDFRGKLQLPYASQGSNPKIVILEATVGTRLQLVAFVADRISDVVVYRNRDLRSGSLRGKGRPRRLVDFDRLVTEEELSGLWVLSP